VGYPDRVIAVGQRVRRFGRALALVAIAGLIAMHAMDAGSAHAMAMLAPAMSAAHSMHDDHTPVMKTDAGEPRLHTGPGHRLDSAAHSMSHACAAVCVPAPAPAHALPGPGDSGSVAGEAAASVVISCAARAPDPPSLFALGVCRR